MQANTSARAQRSAEGTNLRTAQEYCRYLQYLSYPRNELCKAVIAQCLGPAGTSKQLMSSLKSLRIYILVVVQLATNDPSALGWGGDRHAFLSEPWTAVETWLSPPEKSQSNDDITGQGRDKGGLQKAFDRSVQDGRIVQQAVWDFCSTSSW